MRGEKLAEAYFLDNGFKVLERNYRYRRSEIDLICANSDLLLFVEVKYRSTSTYGNPEEFVSNNQQIKILEAADEYIHQINWQHNVRFDIIAINAQDHMEHFQDAFH